MIWKVLTGSAISVKKVNPSGELRSGDIKVTGSDIVVKIWFEEKEYTISDVLSVRSRLVVNHGLEESQELQVLLTKGNVLFLDVKNQSHLLLLLTITGLSLENLKFVLNQINDQHLTNWTYLYKGAQY